jgi:hypothetical protein
MVKIIDCEQGTEEWFRARMGVPTASEFSTIMAKGRDGGASVTRAKYLRSLAGEILTGEPAPEGYSNAHMERGKLQEDEARRHYAFVTDSEPVLVGFMRGKSAGASPDSLIGDDGGLEIKSAIPAVQIDRLQRRALPPEHKAQVQGCMWIAERSWWDFVSYCPRLPPLIIRVERDEAYIDQIACAVSAFNVELDAIVQSIRTYQDFQGQAAA